MSCLVYQNTNEFGGSVYISGTTCSGTVGAYTLNFGDSICMDNEYPLITCENPTIVGSCEPTPTATPTNTQTPTTTTTTTLTSTPTNTQTQTPTNTSTPTVTPTPTLVCLAGSGLTSTSVAKVQTSGNTIYVGAYNATQYNGTPISGLLGINEYGTLVYSGASLSSPSDINYSLIQNDGKIVITGVFTTVDGVSRNRIARLNSNGTLDTSFVIGTGFGTTVSLSNPYATVINSSSDYYVVGSFSTYSGVSRPNIVKIKSNGSLDTSFVPGTGFNSLANSIILQNDKPIVSGYFTGYSGVGVNRIVRLNTDGTIDNTFSTGTGFNNDVRQMIQQPDGKIICVGNFNSYNGTACDKVVRLNSGGTIDNTFTSLGFNNSVGDVTIDVDGNIILVGPFTTYNGITQNRIVKLNPDGTLFAGWNSGTGASGSPSSVATLPDKRIILGSAFNQTYNGYIAGELFLLNEYGTFINCNPIAVTPTRTPTSTATPTEPIISPTNTSTPTATPTMTQTPTTTPECICVEFINVEVTTAGIITYLDCEGVSQFQNVGIGPEVIGVATCINKNSLGGTAIFSIDSIGPCCNVVTPTPTPTYTPSPTPFVILCETGLIEGSYSGLTEYTYPNQPISSSVTDYIRFDWEVRDRPNRFSVYDSTGLLWTSGWVGQASYTGPWGASLNTAVFGSAYICFNSTSGRYVKVEAGNAAPTPPQLTDAYGYTIVCLGSCTTPTPTSTYTPTPTPTSATTLCIDVATNASLDVTLNMITVNGNTAYSIGGVWPNTPGNGASLLVAGSPGTYDVEIFYTSFVSGQHIEINSSLTGYACQNTTTGSGSVLFTGVGFSSLNCLQVLAADGTC